MARQITVGCDVAVTPEFLAAEIELEGHIAESRWLATFRVFDYNRIHGFRIAPIVLKNGQIDLAYEQAVYMAPEDLRRVG